MQSSLFITVILLIVGFVLLIKGADFFVDGSSNIARRFHVPSLIIGMTIVAMGTSLPECSVSITASLDGQNSLAISNAIGSNIFNLMVICGICSIISPLAVKKETRWKDFPLSILCGVLLLFIGYVNMQVSRIDGLILLTAFTVFLIYMIMSAMKARANGTVEIPDEIEKIIPIWQSILYILFGSAAIVYGGDLIIDCASVIAERFGMSQTLIGLTICAIGTSLPELVTSIVAARKNQVDMALGNVIGSNIFNILFVLGIGTTISPIDFIMENAIDITVLIVMSIIVWIFTWTKNQIDRKEGIVMVVMYAGYWLYICVR